MVSNNEIREIIQIGTRWATTHIRFGVKMDCGDMLGEGYLIEAYLANDHLQITA